MPHNTRRNLNYLNNLWSKQPSSVLVVDAYFGLNIVGLALQEMYSLDYMLSYWQFLVLIFLMDFLIKTIF